MRSLKSSLNIYKYLRDLERLGIKSIEDLDDFRNYYTASMLIFNIVNELIEIGEEIVLDEGYYPSTYVEIFEVMRSIGMIDERLFEDLKWLIKLRNLIAHRYERITKGDLFEAVKMIKEIVKRFFESLDKEIPK